MALTLITANGELTLGTAPRTFRPCAFCGGPAQVASDTVAACASCTEAALEVAALIADTAGGLRA